MHATSTPTASSRRPPSRATALQPTRETQPELEQPGLPARRAWTSTSGPTSSARRSPASCVADCFELAARRPRSWTCAPPPTTCARYGYAPVRDRDARGQGRVRAPPSAGSPPAARVLRARLLDVCEPAARRGSRATVVRSRGDLHAHRPLGAARRDHQHPRPRRACPPPTAARTVPGRILRSDNLQTLSEDDVRAAGRRVRPARGDRPAHDAPRSCSRAAARCATSTRSPTGTSACSPSAGTTPTSSPSRRTSAARRPARGLGGVDPAAAGAPRTTRPSRRRSAPTWGTWATGATTCSARCARWPPAARRVGRALRGRQGPHRRRGRALALAVAGVAARGDRRRLRA